MTLPVSRPMASHHPPRVFLSPEHQTISGLADEVGRTQLKEHRRQELSDELLAGNYRHVNLMSEVVAEVEDAAAAYVAAFEQFNAAGRAAVARSKR